MRAVAIGESGGCCNGQNGGLARDENSRQPSCHRRIEAEIDALKQGNRPMPAMEPNHPINRRMSAKIDAVLALVPDHAAWLMLVATFSRCLAWPIPSSLLMLTSGTFAATGDLALVSVPLAAMAGAVAASGTEIRSGVRSAAMAVAPCWRGVAVTGPAPPS